MAIDKVKLPDNSVEEVRDSRIPGIDSAPTANSTNLVTSGGVKSALDGKADDGQVISDFNSELKSGVYAIDGQGANGPGISYGQALVLHSATDTSAQLAFNFTSNNAFFRGGYSWGSIWNSWREFAFKDDLSTALSGYLPLTGGTLNNSGTSADHTLPLRLLNPNPTGDAFIGLSNGTDNIKFGLRGPYSTFGLTIVDPSNNYYKVWHEGNDGSGSGLDADLLDGMDSAAYLPAMAYNFQNGIFVETDCGYGTMLFIRITGNSYGGRSRPIHSEYQAYRYIESEGYLSVAGINYGEYLGPLTMFDYNGHVCFWFEQLSNYETFFIEVFTFEGGWNHVTSVTNAAIPDDSLISYKTVITPTVTYSATKLQTSHTIWGQSFDGTNNVDGVLSLSYASAYRATGIEITSSDSGEASIGFASTNRTVFGRYNNRGFIWGSVAGEIMSLLDNGNVGIGTDTPAYKLDVAGDIRGTSATTTLQTSEPSGGMLPNREYQLGTLSGNTTFTLAAGTSGVTNHYFWSFETGSTAPTITWPSGITSWYGGSAPTINASKHYEVSVLNGVAVVMEV